MSLLLNLQDPGALGALVVPAVMVTGWVLDRVAPTSVMLERARKAKATKLQAEVAALWSTREGAIDWLVLQGHTRASAERAYASFPSRKNRKGATM